MSPVLQSASIATSAAVASNAFAGEFGQSSPKWRHVKRVAFVGSAVIGDAVADLFIGTTYAGTYRITGVRNAPLEAADWIGVNLIAQPNEQLNLRLVTAPTTNAARFFVEYDEIG